MKGVIKELTEIINHGININSEALTILHSNKFYTDWDLSKLLLHVNKHREEYTHSQKIESLLLFFIHQLQHLPVHERDTQKLKEFLLLVEELSQNKETNQ